MKAPLRIVLLVAAAAALAGGAFWAGMSFQDSRMPSGAALGRGAMAASDGTAPAGGPLAGLSDEEQAALEGMTQEERAAWMQERFGDAARSAGPGRGGTLEGTVIDVADDTLTLSVANGSQTVYIDSQTTFAYVEGSGGLETGSEVTVLAEPAADGVTTATLVVIH